MLNAIIVDDEKRGRELMKVLLAKHCPQVRLLGEAASVAQAKDLIIKMEPELVFLDIEMPGGTGFDLLRQFPKINFQVIFVTAFDKYAIQAFRFSAIDYLMKPVDEEDLIAAVKRAEHNMDSKNLDKQFKTLLGNMSPQKSSGHKIALSTAGGLEFIETKDIVRCEADGKYTNCFLSDKRKLIVTKNLGEFEELLTEFNFFRVHHSHLVNLQYIKKYYLGRGGYIVMQDDSTITVSQRKKEDFLSSLKKI